MDMRQAVQSVFRQYATFQGRARRAEYWWFFLFNFLAQAILEILDKALFGFPYGMGMHEASPLSSIFALATLLPALAVCVRRLHDVDRSGWWLLIVFLPVIGAIVLLYWFVCRGTIGPNRFGSDPVTD